MANAGPRSRSGSGQGRIQGDVRLGEGAGLDPGSIKAKSAGPNEPITVAGEHGSARQEQSPAPATPPVAFKDQNAHLVPITALESLTIDSIDDDAVLLPSSSPTATDDPPLLLPSTDLQIASSAGNGPAGMLSLPFELRKKICGHLLTVDMISAEEEATTVLPGEGYGSSLGIHTEILRTNRQIHAEAMEVLYGANDWLILVVEDQNTFQATFGELDMPQRPAINASRRLAPFMEIRISIGREHGRDRHRRRGSRHGNFPSKNPHLRSILDLASFERLCIQRIHRMAIWREATHLQVWHNSYHPDEPKHTARSRSQVEMMIGRIDGIGVTRWHLIRAGDDPRQTIAYVTSAPSFHKLRPQNPHHIFQQVNILARLAGNAANKNDDRGIRFQAMECLRYVHAASLGWRDKQPHTVAPSIREMFAHVARVTTPLVLRAIEITIAMGNTAQAHNAAGLLQHVLWNDAYLPRHPKLLQMTMHELTCVNFLEAKIHQKQGPLQTVVAEMIRVFARWSTPRESASDTAMQWRDFFLAEAPHVLRVVERKRPEIEKYNYQVNYLPLLELSVEQFLSIEGAEKEEWMERLLVHALDFRLHNWLFPKHRIDAVGPCWVWPWSEAWLEE